MVDVQTIGVLVTAASVSLAAIYYIFTLRINMRTQQQTLETRQTQLFIQLYSQYHNKDWVTAAFKTEMMEFQGWDEFWDKYGPSNEEAAVSWDMLSHFFEGAGILVRRGLIDPSLFTDLISEEFVGYWEKFGPMFMEFRVRHNKPKICENQEYLYNLIKEKNLG